MSSARESTVLALLPAMRTHIGSSGAWLSGTERAELANAVLAAYERDVDAQQCASIGELFDAHASRDDGTLRCLFERVAVALVHCQKLVVSDHDHHEWVVAQLRARLQALDGRDLLCAQAAFAELTHVAVLAVATRVLSLALVDRAPDAFVAVGAQRVPDARRESPAQFGPLLYEEERNWLPCVIKANANLVERARYPETTAVWVASSGMEIMPYRALTLVPGELQFWLESFCSVLYVPMSVFMSDMLWQYAGCRQANCALLRCEMEIVAEETTRTLSCAF
jgi:hypothetical protein